jgi:hypothetical protein
MSKPKQKDSSSSPRKIRPAISPEARDNQLIALAYNLVEQRLLEGTATSQETVHFLKLGSARERKELEILELQKELIAAKTQNMNSTQELKSLYADALAAMRNYQGQEKTDE